MTMLDADVHGGVLSVLDRGASEEREEALGG